MPGFGFGFGFGAAHSHRGLISGSTTTLRFAALYNPMLSDEASMSSTRNTAAVRQIYTLAADRTDLVFAWNGWFVNNITGYTVATNTLPIAAAYVSINGVVKQLTWSGATTKTVSPGDNDVRCDTLSPADFGFAGGKFPAGTDVALTVQYNYDAMASKHMRAADQTMADRTGQSARQFDRANTTFTLNNVGAMTETGTASTSLVSGYCPILLGTAPASEKVWVMVGDSLSAGAYDETANANGRGWFQMNCRLRGWASFNMAVSGSKSTAGRDNANVIYWFKFATRGLILKGTNDFSTNGTSTNAPTLLSSVQTISTNMKAQGIGKVGIAKLPPRASSTSDSWATESGQTIATGWQAAGSPYTYNGNLDGASGFDFVIPQTAVRGVDPTKFKVDGTANKYITDTGGTHPNNAGNQLQATEALPLMDAA